MYTLGLIYNLSCHDRFDITSVNSLKVDLLKKMNWRSDGKSYSIKDTLANRATFRFPHWARYKWVIWTLLYYCSYQYLTNALLVVGHLVSVQMRSLLLITCFIHIWINLPSTITVVGLLIALSPPARAVHVYVPWCAGTAQSATNFLTIFAKPNPRISLSSSIIWEEENKE